MSFDLPIPVVQKQPSDSSLRRNFTFVSRLNCALYSKTTNIFRRVQKTLAAPSSSTVVRESLEGIQHALDNNRYALEEDQAVKVEEVNEDEVVEEVVVDRAWNEASTKTSLKSKALSESDGGEVCSESPASIPGIQDPMKRPALLIVFWTLYSHWQQFFNPRFKDINKEIHYQKENWAHSKRLSLWASVFFIGNWILGAALIPTPAVLLDKIYYYGVPAVPLVLLCAFNLPRDHTRFYQCFLFISTWSWSYYQVLFGFLCGYSGRNDLFTCGSKDFSSTFYYTTALQTVALFGLDLKRFPALLGAIIFIVLSGFLIIPEKVKYVSLINHAVNFGFFQIFLMYMHYQREMSARHLFALRIELKEQFERTQKAQINERKAADSKYRLTSYDSLLLHALPQVRVPLNTALLAVQNMSASGTIVKSLELEFTALEGSLSMMSKVLNDVLDFNRMDSGKFESLSRPYAFHHVMRSMLLPLRLATDARKLELVTDLDMNIDEVARRAAYEALGEDRETIDKHMKEQPSGESHFGIVVGDETRLRQIVTNLASNACKFTPAGGKVIIRTRLILPSSQSLPHNEENEQNSIQDESLTTQNVEKHDEENNPENISRIVVRIEVSDTGSGIKPQDMAQSKLFSAFNQTEQGRQQGGKGTGLGLALVRLIVKLSGGRLGVRSRVEEGSTFWVELPLGIGVKAMLSADENNVFSSPARNLSSNTLRQLIKSKSRSNSTQSKTSIIEAVDAAAQRATQASPMTLRSNNALHRLMDQGGSVELNLANHESHTAVPTRMIGDRSTGTEIPMEVLTREESPRPTYVPLPSPRTLAFDSTTSTTSSLPTISPTHLPPSPLANRAFPPPSPSNPLFSHPLHVLVVDDDALTRTLMRRMLERMGCEVTTAENGDLALRILLSPDSDGESSSQSCSNSEQPVASDTVSKFHIIFLDNQMPVLSGVKAIAKLRDLGRRDFVVGVTGNALVSDQREYLDAGVDHVLTKPVLERSLRNMLQLADDRRKLP
ncbi:Tco5, signal transduction HAMP domain histidine kinase [Lentinula edodes]|nr:Tco5, signal transduction HAMP domain histidine kinase [Lentinula edodes]